MTKLLLLCQMQKEAEVAEGAATAAATAAEEEALAVRANAAASSQDGVRLSSSVLLASPSPLQILLMSPAQ